MNDRENYLRAVEFKDPQWIPFFLFLSWPSTNVTNEQRIVLPIDQATHTACWPILRNLWHIQQRRLFNPLIGQTR